MLWPCREITSTLRTLFLAHARNIYHEDEGIIRIVEATIPEHRGGSTGKLVKAK